MRISTSRLPVLLTMSRMTRSRFSAFQRGTMVTLRPGVWHHGPFCVDTDSLQTLIILPERLYAYDCTVLTAPESDKLRIEA